MSLPEVHLIGGIAVFVVSFMSNLAAAEVIASTVSDVITKKTAKDAKSLLKVVCSILVVCTVLHELLLNTTATTMEEDNPTKTWLLTPVILAHLILRFTSSVFQLKLYFGANDGVLATLNRRDIGYGLALSYWHGFLKFVLVRDPYLDDEPSVLDQMEKTGLDFSVKKLCILAPTSCDFNKNDSEWESLYNMKTIKNPVMEPVWYTPVHITQRANKFSPVVARCQDPKSSSRSLTLCFDFPQILKSAASATKVKDTVFQRRKNVEEFVEKLASLIEEHKVGDLVEILCYDDSSLDSTRNLFDLLSKELNGKQPAIEDV